MADSKRYLDWYQKAESDLRGAEILYNSEADNSLVAFHCQQAIEKMLKGYILLNTKKLLDGHSLIFLIRRASVFDPEIKQFEKKCAFVNQFYVETRYPADVPDEVDQSEVAECFSSAREVTAYIRSKEKTEG